MLIAPKVGLRIPEKGYKNNPLKEEQKAANKAKWSFRVRVEHVFGFMENSMNGMSLESRNFTRIEASIGMMNLMYNMFRKI